MSACLTVADSKRVFHRAFPHVIAPLYRRMVDELLVELHLLSRQKGFQADSLFAAGLMQVFDGFSKGYRPPEQRDRLLEALCTSSGFDATRLRELRDGAMAAMGEHSVDEVKQWIEQQGAGAPEPVATVLANVKRADFHYSRLMAVGLLSLLEKARGAESLDPQALRQSAHDVGEAMGLLRERLDKDLTLYTSNLEKMAQAVELMEETVAADRRRRERQAIATEQEREIASEVKGSDQGVPSAG
ncbi:photosystem II biogenesis protein Psp29 [Synechococcus sp. CCY9201]|uniref:photosystem II biogenesis protein Psp29 n=1 Tax=unclassified Synechococcus TaxID=2626047 RepID=UPI0018CE6066|nr:MULTISPECIES: photosystem II biogenesis protein Psp29 [unclassified Synechococcus]MEA5421705.1 photosystem II biogenesis protein Psp29 [Synechococcus sp. CCY9202]MEA5475949.1 photosystem II biogenesis protein Psp29 [Synechococcus sp. CCY9201]QPN59584.1 photosystem II biogenesis protein Psp29 [Synechococcus sp. CBW1002]QPN66404.1 photosystem II biogenesis protein Psp29 [Synechococcus sp. CBW1006]CAK6694006.1 Protein Thf1 [Synechococcus sp. CBW1107]